MSVETEYRTPGQLIQELLDAKRWSQRVLAIVLNADETGINKLIAGKRSLDAKMALDLGDLFGVAPEVFMQLQKNYDLAQARLVARPDPGRTTRAYLFGDLPVAEMIARGWIEAEDVRDPKVESALARFFGVDSPDEIEILPHAAKKTNVASDVTPAQLAWLYRVRQIAAEMMVPKYSAGAAAHAVGKLKALLSAPELAQKVPRILTETGIRYVIVETLPGAKIDGVCLWVKDSPVIGMSLRYDRIDNFWFVLRHEIEHVLRQHGRAAVMFDAELEGDKAGVGPNLSEEERVANEAASDFCVPKTKMDQLVARKAPFFAERDILGFARTLKIHPGLVAGQLQHRTGRHDRHRNHQAKIRAYVAPSAYHDGWGDVAPVGM